MENSSEATVQDLQNAFLAAQEAGDLDQAEIFAKEIVSLMNSPPNQLAISDSEQNQADTEAVLARQAEIDKEAEQYNPASETVRSFAGGLLFNLADEIEASFKAGDLSGEQRQAALDLIRAKHKKFEENNPALSMGAEIAGGLVLPGGAIARGAKGATSFARQLAEGAVTGGIAGYGAAEKPEEDLESALQGAVTGAGVTSALSGAGRLIAPRFSEDVRKLSGAGVELTPGQALGGIPEQLERGAQRIPFIGNAITEAKERGIESFNRGAANKVLSNINPNLKVPAGMSPQDSIDFVNDAISHQYNTNVIPYLKFDAADKNFTDSLDAVVNKYSSVLSNRFPELQKRAEIFKKDLLANPSGNNLKIVKSNLSEEGNLYIKSNEPKDKYFGKALKDIKHNFLLNLSKQNAPISRALIRADKAEEDYIRMADAFASRTSGAGFTPKELGQSIRKQAPSRVSFAERRASRLQPFAQAGENVLGGMPEKSSLNLMELLAPIGGASALIHFSPETAATAKTIGGLSAAAMPLLYSKPVTQSVIPALLAPRPRALTQAGEAMRTISPLSSQLFVNREEQQ
jgi:hypothetical protein